jgi:inosine/xanthosine triphosphatase
MIVAIGTMNPAKVNAVESAFKKVFPKARFIPVHVASGVSQQPIGPVETRNGAINRANAALRKRKDADLGVGIEGGVENTRYGMMICGYVYIIGKDGRTGLGSSVGMQIPTAMAKKILAGNTLGRVMDEYSGKRRVNEHEGAIGYLTKNITSRQEAFRLATAAALAPFLHKNLYDKH